jgi:hypothetical protein
MSVWQMEKNENLTRNVISQAAYSPEYIAPSHTQKNHDY